jgi:hypothetical protein
MNIKSNLLIVILLTSFGLAQPVAAKEFGLYIGAGIGTGTVEAQEAGFNFDESDFAWKVFGGYTFGSFLGIEGSYVDFGSSSGSVSDTDTAKSDVTGFDAFGILGLPIGPVRAFAKLGGINWDSEFTLDDGQTSKDDGTDLAAGLGLEFSLFSIAVRAEVEYFDALDGLYLGTIGATWTF